MNKTDKKNFNAIAKAVRGLESNAIYSSKELEECVNRSGIEVENMGSVLQAIMKRTPYLMQLTDGNYMRTEKR